LDKVDLPYFEIAKGGKTMFFLELIIAAYILGGIPFSYLVGKACGTNILEAGSKNSGPTNLYRTAGIFPAFVAFLLEAAKGIIPVLAAQFYGFDLWQMLAIGISAVIGHSYSPFLSFKGGKGASTLLGVIVAFDWQLAVAIFVFWLITLLISKTVSVATIFASLYFGVYQIFTQEDYLTKILCGVIALFVVAKHWSNIVRIIQCKEPLTIQKAKKDAISEFPSGVKKGSFTIHQTKDDPQNTKERMSERYPILNVFPAWFIHNVIFPNIPLSKLNMGRIVIKDKFGTMAGLEYRAVPYTPKQMIRYSKSALAKLRTLVEMSIDAGAKICGLGAYTSIIGNGGKLIADEFSESIGVTTGNSYTTGMAIRGVESLSKEVGYNLADCTLAVIGATGAIGSIVAEMMTLKVDKIYLVGRDTDDARLRTLVSRIKLLGGDAIIAPLEIALANSEIVVSATSKTEALDIDPSWFRENAIICDVARPRDIAREVAKARKDVIILDGGLVRCPELVEQTWSFGYEYGILYACMAETLILLLKGVTKGKHSLEVTKESVTRLLRWGDELGFKLDGYRSLDIPITAERIKEHRKSVLTKQFKST
jgi:acyl-phosphate glycerol 3-phosphate acyltransferase